MFICDPRLLHTLIYFDAIYSPVTCQLICFLENLFCQCDCTIFMYSAFCHKPSTLCYCLCRRQCTYPYKYNINSVQVCVSYVLWITYVFALRIVSYMQFSFDACHWDFVICDWWETLEFKYFDRKRFNLIMKKLTVFCEECVLMDVIIRLLDWL